MQYRNEKSTLSKISYTHRPKTIEVNKKNRSFLEAPGPGTYESVELTSSDGKYRISKYSNSRLSVIQKDRRFKEEKFKTPGPSLYGTLDSLSKNSKYILSSRRGQGTRPFDRERKFTNKYWRYDANPAPGSYDRPSDFGVYGDTEYYRTLSFKK
jgi:hypothetical protein